MEENFKTEHAEILKRLQTSDFRAKFHLKQADLQYVEEKGMETIKTHAFDFIRKRLAPAQPQNDGKQTPMRGHPVFIAQHATATCCRGCLSKWHKIPQNHALTEKEIEFVVTLILKWIEQEKCKN